MSEKPTVEREASPAGEHIHMPPSSVLPVINAAALAGVIVFATMSVPVCIFFLVVFLVSTGVWIRDTVRDVNELPLDHHADGH